MSARQSPPSASATARSSTILPGSWCANGFRHGDNASDSAAVSPVFSAVRSSSHRSGVRHDTGSGGDRRTVSGTQDVDLLT